MFLDAFWGVCEDRVVTVAMTRGAIVVLAAIVVGGCGGGEEQEQVFRPADATRIANVRPVMPGWTWPQNPEKPETGVISLGEAGHKWRDDNKLANLVALVFASAADAHERMAPLKRFLPRVGRE
jgi:hypothetical protein